MRFPAETMGMGRDFPIMVKEYEDPQTHWGLDWIVWGTVVGTACVLALFLLLFWPR